MANVPLASLLLITLLSIHAINAFLLTDDDDGSYFTPSNRLRFQPYKHRASDPTKPSNPVVLVPGDGGSHLLANLTGKPSAPHFFCYTQTENYYDLYLDPKQLFPFAIDCWADNIKLNFDEKTQKTSNAEGVDVVASDIGDTLGVEYLYHGWNIGGYFAHIIDALTSWGYQRGKNLIGAPYDWRKSPAELTDFYVNLKAVIEKTYTENNDTSVVMITHSMGSPLMNYFYHNYVDQAWKDKYIKSHVSLAGAWGGSVKILQLYAYGYTLGYPRFVLPPKVFREVQRSFPSSAMLFPSNKLWTANDTLLTTTDRTYTIEDVEDFFEDAGYSLGHSMHKRYNQDQVHEAPGVEMHCVQGSGINTPESLHWQKVGEFPDGVPNTVYGDGDGTVNVRSLGVCGQWNQENNNGKRVQMRNLEKANHMSILRDDRTVKYIRKVLYNHPDQ